MALARGAPHAARRKRAPAGGEAAGGGRAGGRTANQWKERRAGEQNKLRKKEEIHRR